jgi:protein involved in polysaccharide export with SLBB domain
MSLADVIALAGGLTMSANRGDVRLVREEETLMVTDQGSIAGVDVPIESGDRIVVGRRSWAAENLPLLIGTASSVLVSLVTVLILR